MSIQKFFISRDPVLYEAWPDVALTPGGKLVAVFSECIHHIDRSYTQIMLTESVDRGRTWSPKRPLTPAARKPRPSRRMKIPADPSDVPMNGMRKRIASSMCR